MVNNLIKALGWSIFHSLWQGAIIYALLFTLLIATPKLSAKVKHNLAFGSLLLIFSSFCFTFYSVFEIPLTEAEKLATQAFISSTNFQGLSLSNTSSFLKTEALFPLITAFYILGISVQLLVLLLGYTKLKTLKKSSTIAVPAEWNAAFEVILFRLKINKPVQFFLSAKVNVPLVIGYFKPMVLFPIALTAQLDLKQVEAILIHELSHIRRNDYALNLVKTAIETLLFFNPFIWLASKFIRIEREHACDDIVVSHTGTPLTYAHALLKLELLKDKQAPTLSLAATGTNQHLYQRIKRITNMKTTYINAKQQLVILALALSTVLSLAWMNPTKPEIKRVKSLSNITKNAFEAKNISHRTVVNADTDTAKKKHKKEYVIKTNGKTTVYTSLDEMPDSLKENILKMERKFNSPEWKEKMAKIQENAEAMNKKFESKEWKDQMAKIEENALAVSKKFESKEWKDQMAKIEGNALAMSKKFESKEWKDQMAKIEENALAMSKKFESKEWKDQMAKIEENALAISKKFESKEWKDQMAKIELNAKDMEKKFNSPEWKQKIEEMKKLHESPEFKDLQKKFEKDVEELKKQKGIKVNKL